MIDIHENKFFAKKGTQYFCWLCPSDFDIHVPKYVGSSISRNTNM